MQNQIVLYVQMGETRYRSFFETHLKELQAGFLNQGMTLVFLPALLGQDTPDVSDGLRAYLEFYYPSFRGLPRFQQDQALHILLKSQHETDVYEKLNSMFGLNLRNGAYLFYIKPGRFEFERLGENEDPESVLKKYLYNADQQRASRAYQLDSTLLEDFYAQNNIIVNPSLPPRRSFSSIRSALDYVMESGGLRDNVNEGEIHPELARMLDLISQHNLEGGAVKLIDQVLMTLAATRGVIYNGLDEWTHLELPENLQLTDGVNLAQDDQIYLLSRDQKLDFAPMHRAVYALFMKHPEGIIYDCINDYREELHSFYLRFTGTQNLETIRERIDLICSYPRDNSLLEKISRINKYIRSLGLGPSQELYTISGPRGGPRKIHLSPQKISFGQIRPTALQSGQE